MTIGADICEAAARDAFGVELDHSMESIALLNSLIINGWGVGTNPISGTNEPSTERFDPTFIFGAYLGEVFVRTGIAEWRWENSEAFLYFRNSKRKNFPFDLIERKLREPNQIDLAEETALWLTSTIPLDNATNRL